MSGKPPCRYGRGCTHINDPSHQAKFCHPLKQELNAEEMRRNYICNECALGFDSLAELRLHLMKKTAWSNESLIGSRISCLVDCKEWHEGLVTQYHRSGKHCVEFNAVNEKRWFHMLKLAFYIIEPVMEYEKSEFKDAGEDECNMCTQKDWTYYEDISFDYAFTQSVLFKVYGGVVQETGHKTQGHVSLTEYDRCATNTHRGSLLYGELLPRGVNKALDPYHLDAAKARVLFDMGMGTGKVTIQAFLQFRNLMYVYGVELSVGRYLVAEAAALRMVQLLGQDAFQVDVIHGEQITVTELGRGEGGAEKGRVLRLQRRNMMEVKDIRVADIIMMETDVPANLQLHLCTMIQHEMHDNARILSYHDLLKIWPLPTYSFKQLDINCSLTDRFPTSWSVQRGHHFFLFKKSDRSSSKHFVFQRHMQRSTSRASPSSTDVSSSNGTFGSDVNVCNSIGSTTQHNAGGHDPYSISTSAADCLSKDSCHEVFGGKYRESDAFSIAFPLPDEAQHSDAAAYRHQKEIPQLQRRRSGGNGGERVSGAVDIVEESDCRCCPFSFFVSCLFALSCRRKKHEQDKGKKSVARQRSRDKATTLGPGDTTSPSSLPPSVDNSSFTTSLRASHSPGKVTSNSPRSVLVERNKANSPQLH